jgi:hypothetical protein
MKVTSKDIATFVFFQLTNYTLFTSLLFFNFFKGLGHEKNKMNVETIFAIWNSKEIVGLFWVFWIEVLKKLVI